MLTTKAWRRMKMAAAKIRLDEAMAKGVEFIDFFEDWVLRHPSYDEGYLPGEPGTLLDYKEWSNLSKTGLANGQFWLRKYDK